MLAIDSGVPRTELSKDQCLGIMLVVVADSMPARRVALFALFKVLSTVQYCMTAAMRAPTHNTDPI